MDAAGLSTGGLRRVSAKAAGKRTTGPVMMEELWLMTTRLTGPRESWSMLPVEMMAQILSHAHPMTLLMLSRTSKGWHRRIMGSTQLWTQAFEPCFKRGLAPPPATVSLPRYAQLVFEWRCDHCETNEHRDLTIWPILARLCSKCRTTATTSLHVLRDTISDARVLHIVPRATEDEMGVYPDEPLAEDNALVYTGHVEIATRRLGGTADYSAQGLALLQRLCAEMQAAQTAAQLCASTIDHFRSAWTRHLRSDQDEQNFLAGYAHRPVRATDWHSIVDRLVSDISLRRGACAAPECAPLLNATVADIWDAVEYDADEGQSYIGLHCAQPVTPEYWTAYGICIGEAVSRRLSALRAERWHVTLCRRLVSLAAIWQRAIGRLPLAYFHSQLSPPMGWLATADDHVRDVILDDDRNSPADWQRVEQVLAERSTAYILQYTATYRQAMADKARDSCGASLDDPALLFSCSSCARRLGPWRSAADHACVIMPPDHRSPLERPWDVLEPPTLASYQAVRRVFNTLEAAGVVCDADTWMDNGSAVLQQLPQALDSGIPTRGWRGPRTVADLVRASVRRR